MREIKFRAWDKETKKMSYGNIEHFDDKHGEEKNRRIESDWEGNFGSEQTVSERYCAVCHEWKTAKGIIGGFGCPDCGTSWDQKF